MAICSTQVHAKIFQLCCCNELVTQLYIHVQEEDSSNRKWLKDHNAYLNSDV